MEYKAEGCEQQSVADFNEALASTPDELTEFLAAVADVGNTISSDDENYEFFTTAITFSSHELYCEHMGKEFTLFVPMSKQSRLCDYLDEAGEPVYTESARYVLDCEGIVGALKRKITRACHMVYGF